MTLEHRYTTCPDCGRIRLLGDGECSPCYFDRLKASGLYPPVEVDLSASDRATLDRWHTLLVTGLAWPEDFPVPEPRDFRADRGTRTDAAWHAWSECMIAVSAAIEALDDRGRSWRDRPPLL